MWSMVSCNRILDKRMKNQAHRKHLISLRTVKSQINNKTPADYSFLRTRPKARQIQYQRKRDIDNSNSILVEKMMTAHTSLPSKDSIFIKESLNIGYLKKKQRQIDLGNQALVRRLQCAYSEYNQKNFSESNKTYFKLKSNMAHSRVDPCYDLQVNPAKSSINQRPFSAKR